MIWLSASIIFLPLIASLIALFLWNRNSQFSKMIILGAIAISAMLAIISFAMEILNIWDAEFQGSTIWIPIGLSTIPVSFLVDKLSTFMVMVSSGLGLLIGLFSLEYMEDEEKQLRYWFFFSLFVFGMNLLVLAGNFVFLLIGWEVVGLCSFILIGYWYYKPDEEGRKARNAGLKAFLMTQVGDLGLFGIIVIIYSRIHSLSFDALESNSFVFTEGESHMLSIFLLLAAFGKSAQFPFISWLSSPDSVDVDAMQGPTTVSALIHAATMVKAGVYLVSRFYLLMPHDMDFVAEILLVVASLTAIITGLSALTSSDIKRVLAYSTVSQLSFMFTGLGVAFMMYDTNQELAESAFLASQAHLLSHAVFKSLLFLTAGYLIHLYHSRNLTELSGTANFHHDKIAWMGMLFGSISLIGLPPFNGFFSKEEIVGTLYEGMQEDPSIVMKIGYYSSLIAILLTAAYSTRLIYYLVIRSPDKELIEIHVKIMQRVIILLSVITLLTPVVMIIGQFQTDIDEIMTKIALNYDVELLLTLSFVILTMVVTYQGLVHPAYLKALNENRVFRFGKHIVDEGFYVDAFWTQLWKTVIYLTSYGKRIHAGNINVMARNAILTTLVLVVIIAEV